MFEEPVRFFLDVARRDASFWISLRRLHLRQFDACPSLRNALTWVNREHGPGIDNAGQFNRGGLLPMAVFLTRTRPACEQAPSNAATGFASSRILGERIPARRQGAGVAER